MDEAVKQKLKDRAAGGRISCEDAWKFAEEHGLSRAEIGEACNELGIRIFHCQLGCF